jgi:hypothetical protein
MENVSLRQMLDMNTVMYPEILGTRKPVPSGQSENGWK